MTDTQVITECQCEKRKRLCAKNPGWFAPDEAKRAIEMGLVGSLACAIGAGFQWGIGTAFFTFGLILWIDTIVDEVVERITKISRQ